MYTKNTYLLYLCLLVLSVVGIFSYGLIPERTLSLWPSSDYIYTASGDLDIGGESTARYLDASYTRWTCTLRPGVELPSFPACRAAISFVQPSDNDWTAGLDLSSFDSIRFHYTYTGPARFLRVHFRNYDDNISNPKDFNSPKFIKLIIREPAGTVDLNYSLSEFTLADWWIQQYAVPTKQAKIAFDRVTGFEVDFAEPVPYGEHFIEFHSVQLSGKLITKDSWYLGILVFWLVVAAFVIVFRLKELVSTGRKQALHIKQMHEYASELKTQFNSYHNLSYYDSLTGLLNRLGATTIIESAFEWRKDTNKIALMILDIDFFKRINDGLGHDAGDQVLRRFGQLLLNNTRPTDTVARWGGEEFIIIVPQTPKEACCLIAEKLRCKTQETQFFDSGEPSVTVSIGATIIDAKESFEVALKRADTALYDAKGAGRNRWVFK